ncbi:MAG: thiamine pyrophosphate-binding protein [Woeseiaceae bacterium]
MSTNAENLIGRRAIAEAIHDAGIDTIFTVAGGHFLPTFHEIGQLAATRVVAARHEQGAGYMASGHALVTGKPGVVFSGAPGPGATNLVTAVANAQADSIPLLVISAQVDRRYVHRNILQYCDNVALFEPFCKRSVQAVSIGEVANLLATSLQLAVSGRPGPVHVCLPQNLQVETLSEKVAVNVAEMGIATPSADEIETIREVLADSTRPTILAGHGVVRSGGSSALAAIAEQLGAPVATSRSGIGSLPTTHSSSVGMLGFYGPKSAQEAVSQADLVLIVGCALGEQTTMGWRDTLFAPDATIIHVDVDASQINRTYAVNQGVTCDASAFLAALDGRIGERECWFTDKPERSEPQNDSARGLSAATFLQALNKHAPDDVIVSADIGNHRLWVCEQLDVTRPDGLLQSCEFDAMGFSMPTAIGASIASPGTKIVTISGDGGFVHTMGELAVAREHELPIVAVVFVDGALGILRHQAEGFYGEDHFVRLAPIDFDAVASACGVEARTVSNEDELDEALIWSMDASGPVLLSVVIDPEEVFPPLLTKIEQRRIDLVGKQ